MRRRKIFTEEFELAMEKGLHAALFLMLAVMIVYHVVR